MATYSGEVTVGEGRATTLGFPTINIPLTDESVSGIYAGTVIIEDTEYLGAIYADQRRKILEAHLLDFPGGSITGLVSMNLDRKIREDSMFPNDEALKEAILGDIEDVRNFSTE